MVEEAGASRRERLHDATREEIKALARRQMAEEGTAALSLRAIARQMGLTAPALYRYYRDRDELITALILDAFNAQADTLEAVRASIPAEQYARQLLAAMLAYREWALAHPADYVLVLGNPIPGYQAPGEATTRAARRTLTLFLEIIEGARQAGQLTVPAEYGALLARTQQQIVGGADRFGYALPHPALEIVLGAWAKVHGLISLELYGHLQPIIADPGALYHFEVLALLAQLGFDIADLG